MRLVSLLCLGWLASGARLGGKTAPPPPASAASLLSAARPRPVLSLEFTERDLSDGEMLEFAREGHMRLSGLLAESAVEELASLMTAEFAARKQEAVQHYRSVLGTDEQPPFHQLFNTWRSNAQARRLILDPGLGRLAAQLLDCGAVRLYQDSIFVKDPQHGPTEWHSDLKMCPLNTNDFLTFWIPLQPVPDHDNGGTGLVYASKSHADFALPFWFNPDEMDLSERYVLADHGAYSLGDASVHHGWCLHSAPPNLGDSTRVALSLSFVADGAPTLPLGAPADDSGLLRRPDMEDSPTFADWLPAALEEGYLQHELCPMVFGQLDEEEEQEEGER